MGRNLTRREAEKKLEYAVSSFDWVKAFLNDKQEFINKYLALHAQLKEGDQLSIRVRKIDGDRHHDYPVFDIMLDSPEGSKTVTDRAVLYDKPEPREQKKFQYQPGPRRDWSGF